MGRLFVVIIFSVMNRKIEKIVVKVARDHFKKSFIIIVRMNQFTDERTKILKWEIGIKKENSKSKYFF